MRCVNKAISQVLIYISKEGIDVLLGANYILLICSITHKAHLGECLLMGKEARRMEMYPYGLLMDKGKPK